jgi:hypothetical protein
MQYEAFPFRFRDPVTGKWRRARRVASLAEIAEQHAEWEVTGPAVLRTHDPDGLTKHLATSPGNGQRRTPTDG